MNNKQIWRLNKIIRSLYEIDALTEDYQDLNLTDKILDLIDEVEEFRNKPDEAYYPVKKSTSQK